MFATILKQLALSALLFAALDLRVLADSLADTTTSSTFSRSKSDSLEEIIVTAEKREERVQDVPIPMTVLNPQSLADQNQVLVRDFASTVPGLNISPAGNFQTLAIRGITTGYNTNPTVGITIDDVPFGATNGNVIPDLDPGSLERVEVLRGPQGTLYGANAMGGLLKFVTIQPSTAETSGSVQAGTSVVSNGAEPGYNFRGSMNVPITDTLAVRLSGFTRQDPGYIDNVFSKVDGVNEAKSYGGLLAALWRPTDLVSLKVNALYQDLKGDGAYEVDQQVNGYPPQVGSPSVITYPAVRGLQQAYIANLGGYDRVVQLYSATLNAKLGFADLTSLTAYNISKYGNNDDATYQFGALIDELLHPGAAYGSSVATTGATDRFTEEVRLSIPFGQRFQWLLGGFYSRETDSGTQNILAVDPGNGTITDGNIFNFLSSDSHVTEFAAFTNLEYQITDKFDVQLGGRESRITEDTGTISQTGNPILGLDPVIPKITPSVHEDLPSKFTYLVTPRFKFSADLMAYARVATGYQLGGVNALNGTGPLFDPNIPGKFTSSTTTNYELGVKGDVLDHMLSFDASIYYIDWSGLQVNVQSPINQFNYTANASSAKSDGVELSVTVRPLTGLTVGAWIDYDDAVLTKGFPPGSSIFGVEGDRLPYSARFSGNFSVDQEFPLTNTFKGVVGATAGYVGNRPGTFVTTSQRQDYPSYTKVDLRAGVSHETWRAELYANNVGDSRGELGGGSGTFPPFGFILITPRTVGINFSEKF